MPHLNKTSSAVVHEQFVKNKGNQPGSFTQKYRIVDGTSKGQPRKRSIGEKSQQSSTMTNHQSRDNVITSVQNSLRGYLGNSGSVGGI